MIKIIRNTLLTCTLIHFVNHLFYILLPVLLVFGEAKLCKFDGLYYCYECHLDEERLIPARILLNWDFRKHKVCVRSSEYLDSIEVIPVLNIEETNKALYHYIPELEETRVSNLCV